MRVTSTYRARITQRQYYKAFGETAKVYNGAVSYFIRVIDDRWDLYKDLEYGRESIPLTERLCHHTKQNPLPVYDDFDRKFYKFPSYLRRAAIAEAYGKVRSYRSSLADWEALPEAERGKKPGFPKAGNDFPALYRGNMFVRLDDRRVMVKLFIRNTWDWVTLTLRKTDCDYIKKYCGWRKECVPTMQKRWKVWSLDFPYACDVKLSDTPVFGQTAVSVDLGINNCCTMAAMLPDGTVAGRKFFRLPAEYDCLRQKVGRVRRAQSHGSRCVRKLWKFADGVNDDIAVKTARAIVDFAVLYNADVIVFEHLDLSGKKHGSKKQKLHLWKAKRVQAVVRDKAHLLGMHVSTVCAWGTSRLAYDGSGWVKRGKESDKTNGSYSVCEFQSGKVYNCDLNASYNIGARYFIREILKSLPAKEERSVLAKVPDCTRRSTCTLSSLISLDSVLYASA